jgi:hypothetical protein
MLNGAKPKQVTLESSGGWDSWGMPTEIVSLEAGTNTIPDRFDATDRGNAHLDCFPCRVAQRVQGPPLPPLGGVGKS